MESKEENQNENEVEVKSMSENWRMIENSRSALRKKCLLDKIKRLTMRDRKGVKAYDNHCKAWARWIYLM